MAAPDWMSRVAFRFSVLYLGLFALATQISGSMLPNFSFTYRGLGPLWPLRDLWVWTARHVFGLTSGLDAVSGGEPVLFWVQAFWLLVAAVLGTALWSALDRRRAGDETPLYGTPLYGTLHGWFRLFVRLALAASMFEYGMTKVIPTQFPAPSLSTLVTPVGDLSLSALLWTSIGSSPAYEIFTGCVELLGGILLLLPRTTLLGALISLAAATQVFVLNMTYDIGLKLISFHLMLLALFLIAPDMPRLVDLFLRDPGEPGLLPPSPRLRRTSREPRPTTPREPRRTRRLAQALPIVFGVYLLGMYAYINVEFWEVGGGGRPRSPLYGIWDVEQLSVDGVVRPPDLYDYDRRWRRVILDAPDSVVFQRIDDSFARYGASVDAGGMTLVLRKGNSRSWKATFTVERRSPDRLILEGEMDDRHIEAKLRLVDPETFRLLNSTFRWVRPHEP